MARNGFSLESDPFPIESGGGCFFSTPALRDRLDTILRRLRHAPKPILVVAPPGSGKTTLLEQVLKDLDSRWQVARLSARPEWDEGALLAAVGDAFDPDRPEDGSAEKLRERLEAHFSALERKGLRALVALDDADLLNAETRAGYGTLAARWQSLGVRRIDLSAPARPESSGEAGGEADEDDSPAVIDLPALTPEQSDDYVHLRLCAAGLMGDSPFTDEALRSIHNASGGRPGAIHRVSRQVLANQQATERRGRRAAAPSRRERRAPSAKAAARSAHRRRAGLGAVVAGLRARQDRVIPKPAARSGLGRPAALGAAMGMLRVRRHRAAFATAARSGLGRSGAFGAATVAFRGRGRRVALAAVVVLVAGGWWIAARDHEEAGAASDDPASAFVVIETQVFDTGALPDPVSPEQTRTAESPGAASPAAKSSAERSAPAGAAPDDNDTP